MDDRERSRATRVRAGRWISTGGLIGLTVVFFLPQVSGCGERIEPASRLVGHNPSLFPFFFPFYFAFAMLAIYLLRALLRP